MPTFSIYHPQDWFAPDVLIAPPEYYSIENSGPSSDESESETDEEDEDDEDDMDTTPGDSALTSRASSRVSSRNGPSYDKSYLRDEGIDSSAQGSSVASSQVDDEEDSKVDDESEEQSVLDEDEFDFRNCFPYEGKFCFCVLCFVFCVCFFRARFVIIYSYKH